MSGTPFLQQVDKSVEGHGHEAQKHDGHQEPIHLEHLAGVDDEIPQAASGRQEFSDDDSYQAQADIDLHVADDGGDGTWQHHLDKGLQPTPPEGVDQLDLPRVHSGEAGVQV